MAIKFNEKKEIKLHIGGGNEYLNDWINVDNNPYNMISKLDLNLDIYKPLPFKDNSVNMIYDKSFLKKIETLSDADIEAFLWNFRCMLKPAGVLKIEITYPYMKNQLEPWLNKLGFPNVEFNCTIQEPVPEKIMNNVKDIIHDEVVVIDWLFPQKEPGGFRNVEINGLLNIMNNLNTYTMHPMYPDKDAWSPYPYGIEEDTFKENKNAYLKIYPENKDRLKYLSPDFKYNFKLAYSYFLGETYTLLPFYEKNEIPFVFILYPAGAFGLNNESSDTMLRKIFASKYFKKVIVTQKVTRDYLIEKRLCPPAKIEFLFGGYVQFNKDEILPKKYYKKDKSTFDICFVANKYSSKGIDKGYDLFIETAKQINVEFPDARFHVVGSFDETIIDVSQIKNIITFYGVKPPEFFKDFYSKMDICLSPNRVFTLYEGHFDGFPLGADALSCGTALFATDELNNNDGYFNDDEIIIIKPEIKDIVNKIKHYINDLDSLYMLSKKGMNKLYSLVNTSERVQKVSKILKETSEEKIIIHPKVSIVTLGQTIKLNIGCGSKYVDGWTNVDNDPENKNKLDLNWNLNDPLPYQDSLIDFIYCSRSWEDLNTDEGWNSITDLNRILKPCGALRLAITDLKDSDIESAKAELSKKITDLGFNVVKPYDAKISNYFEFVDLETESDTNLFIEAVNTKK